MSWFKLLQNGHKVQLKNVGRHLQLTNISAVIKNLFCCSIIIASGSALSETNSTIKDLNQVLPKLPTPTTAAANVVVVDANNEPVVLSFLGLTFKDNLALFDRGYATPKSSVAVALQTPENSSPRSSESSSENSSANDSAIALELGFKPNLDILPAPIEEPESNNNENTTSNAPQAQNQVTAGSTAEADLIISVDQEQVDQDLAAIKETQFTHPDWERLAIVPSENKYKGRFATASAVVNNMVYLLGGYSNNTVSNPARKPNEQNITDFYSYNPLSKEYAQLADMPVPVDDTVLLPYRDRYLYAISGWHKDGAVNLVQVFDIFKNEWFQASPILGNGVFGHAGGIVDNVLLVCDGASMKRNFAQAPSVQIEQSCLLGEIDPMNPSYIQWQEWAHPGEHGRFRMAAVSDVQRDQICFVGGATEPYDIHGKTSQGTIAKGTTEVWCYQAESRRWQLYDAPTASYGHRSAIIYKGNIITLGGRNQQGIIDDVIVHKNLK